MSERRTVDLDRIGVATPCGESWDGMEGDDRVRYCDRCALHVYNLSGMSRDEASDLVSGADERLCVRFFRRTDGTVLTRDCPVGLARRTGRWMRSLAAGLLAVLGFLPACGSDAVHDSASPPSAPPTEEPVEETTTEPLEEQGEMEIVGDLEIPEEAPVLQGKIVMPPEEGEKR